MAYGMELPSLRRDYVASVAMGALGAGHLLGRLEVISGAKAERLILSCINAKNMFVSEILRNHRSASYLFKLIRHSLVSNRGLCVLIHLAMYNIY